MPFLRMCSAIREEGLSTWLGHYAACIDVGVRRRSPGKQDMHITRIEWGSVELVCRWKGGASVLADGGATLTAAG